MNLRTLRRSATAVLASAVLVLALIGPAFGQRGSFGRSGGFGGGGFSRSSGGSFGRSSGSGSFGRSSGSSGSSSFGRSSSPSATSGGGGFFGGSSSRNSGSGSFGRSGSFGGSGRVNSTTNLGPGFAPPPSYQGIPYSTRSTVYYGGSQVPAFGYGFLGGYSLGMLSSPWTHWMPFHPAFYVDPPSYYNGAYYAGGFSMFRFIIGLIVIWLIFRFVRRLFFRDRFGGGGDPNGGAGGGFGGGRKIKYTVYK